MSTTERSRVNLYQVSTAITAASATPPADALITLRADPGDATGIHVPKRYVGEPVVCVSQLTTTGGAPSMTLDLYGYVRYYIAQDTTTETYAGAGSTGRWHHIHAFNSGAAVTAAANPECIPAANVLLWNEVVEVGAMYERLLIHLAAAAGTDYSLDTFIGWYGGTR